MTDFYWKKMRGGPTLREDNISWFPDVQVGGWPLKKDQIALKGPTEAVLLTL